MKITFLGATETVTGSKYLLESKNNKVLIDCGLFQGYKSLRNKNRTPLPLNENEIEGVLLTHAHLDHTGYLPLLVKNGFNGSIYATKATRDLCSILLPDSGYLQEEDARRANKYGYTKHKKALPLYTKQEAESCLALFKTIEYDNHYQIANCFDVHWHRAGHILGSSYVVCAADQKTILFTGDLGRPEDPILRTRDKPKEVDYLVIESTYGGRLHESEPPEALLEKIINKTSSRGGTVVIPSFAVGRTQNLLFHIQRLRQANRIPDLPVYLDSPMAINATDILCNNADEHKLSQKECAQVCNVAEYTRTPDESKQINKNTFPKIIISASGMATGGRVLHHLKEYAPSHLNTILFTGYQAGGTRGANIMRGVKTVRIHGMDIPINADVEILTNTSAHADYQEMLDWLGELKRSPKHIFITHGEEKAAESLKEKIENRFGFDCSIPKYLDKVSL